MDGIFDILPIVHDYQLSDDSIRVMMILMMILMVNVAVVVVEGSNLYNHLLLSINALNDQDH
jgi:hypothetical protein